MVKVGLLCEGREGRGETKREVEVCRGQTGCEGVHDLAPQDAVIRVKFGDEGSEDGGQDGDIGDGGARVRMRSAMVQVCGGSRDVYEGCRRQLEVRGGGG